MRWLYTLVFYLFLPFLLLHLLWRRLRAPAYGGRWAERFGIFPAVHTDKTPVWIHTVSVGEFLGALPIIRALLQQPELHLIITTSTPTGSERVRQTLGDRVTHIYAPFDVPDCIGRFLTRTQPRLMLIMETELWPNTIAACTHREIPVMLMNARLSARSARGYARAAALSRSMLQQLAMVGAQHRDDAERLQALGVLPERCVVTGNLKFDLTLDNSIRTEAARLKQQWSDEGQRLIWIAASTHLGEDEQLLEVFSRLRESGVPGAEQVLLVLVPRHPERFERVGQLCENRHFSVVRRSSGEPVTAQTNIVLGDTMGELLLLFGASDLAFMGGSLVPNGGHNFIEPAAWGLPLLSGPHLFNFAEVSRLLEDAGALMVGNSVEELTDELKRLVAEPDLRQRCGAAALGVADDNRGALEQTLALVRRYL